MQWKTTSILMLGLLFTGVSAAADNVINVSGKSNIATTPDAFTITLVIEERGPVVAKLNEQANAKLEDIVGFLLGRGIDKKHIQSMTVNLNPWYEHSANGREDKGFILSRQIRVTSTELDAYDAILDGVARRGISRIDRFEFVTLNTAELYQQALIEAVHDAKARAELLAKQLGVNITGVVSVVEGGSNFQQPMVATMRMKEADSFSLPGQSDINANVNVTFSIAD